MSLLALPILMWVLADPSLWRYPREAVAAATYTANLVHPAEGEAGVLLHT